MPKGISLHIGLNSVDPRHYAGWSGPLAACEADADDMEAIAKEKGFKATKLLTKDGTRDRIVGEITRAAKSLKAGDIFFLSYSGHGGQLPDRNRDEADRIDETWCLFDGQLVDDHLYDLYTKFAKGVRIFVLSDSCHSGSVASLALREDPKTRGRAMPEEVALRTYRANKAFYDPILADPTRRESRGKVQASLLLISGCQDNQLSSDGDFNGLFTATLLSVWNNGAFKGDYPTLHRQILRRMPRVQTPNYFPLGIRSAEFERQVPFTV
ncbi:MAG TPA: caspase family protein [Longimicrobiaceae bacterium]|nr:caspase family protein [Longimicrobiaceae bacterium]